MPHGDENARNRIHEALNETLFVEAGAGTGKTTALVGRIVNLVGVEGVELKGIAAITFTRKAAGELRDRVRQKLEEAAAGGGVFEDTERERCRKAIVQVDAAAIETLDAFASRIVSDHPLEAGLPPRFEMQDQVQAVIAFEERWDMFREALFADPDLEPLLDRAFTLGLTPDHLREIALRLVDQWDRVHDEDCPDSPLEPVDASELSASLRLACQDASRCTDKADGLYQHLLAIAPYADELAAAKLEDDLLDLLLHGPKLTAGSVGNQKAWDGVKPKDIREALKGVDQVRLDMLAGLRAAVLPPLLKRICRLVTEYAEERRCEGRQGFHDILVRARDLLRDHADVRALAHERYQRLLIDEFQDTDPLQIEIAVLIAGDWDGTWPFDWRTVSVPDGRLFFVGDPKQSIYRFRRADIALYQSVQQRFGDTVVHLRRNFRSRSLILGWVNAVFERLMGSGDGQAAYVSLEPRDDAPDAAPSVHLLGGPSDEEKPSADGLRRSEARDIVEAIKTVMALSWSVVDPGTGETRPARYEDIAVLLPTRTSLPILERALEDADIPFRVEARSLIYGTEDIRNLLSVLRTLNDPTDEVALVAALRSPAFACADDELYAFKMAGGQWDYRDPRSTLEADHPVIAAMGWLRKVYEDRWALGVSGTVAKVLSERHFYELALAHRRPRDHWKRLRLILDQAREATESGATNLGSFLRLIDQLSEAAGSNSDNILPDPDDDAVRILTIHAAKGLEFPVVVMAGLSTKDGARQDSIGLVWDAGRPELKVGPKDACFLTPGYEAAAAREDEMERLEKIRLLYVAATRARDHLVVSVHHEGGKGSHAQRLHEHAIQHFHLCGPFAADADGWTAPSRGKVPPDGREDRTTWEAHRQAQIEANGMLHAMAATAVAKEARTGTLNLPDQEDCFDAPADDGTPWKRGRAGTSLGRAVHAVLQSIDLDADSAVDAAARHQATVEGIPEREREVARLVRSALSSDLVRRTVSEGHRYWREVYVSAVIDGVTLEGFIDLLVETPDGYVIADFKTDATDPIKAMDRYRLQGASYVLCVERLLGKPVSRCVFLFVQSEREEPVTDLPGACEEVRSALRRQTVIMEPAAAVAEPPDFPLYQPDASAH